MRILFIICLLFSMGVNMPNSNGKKPPKKTEHTLSGRWYSRKTIKEMKQRRINLHPALYDLEKPGKRSTMNRKGKK
jgi:hypothetical protein